MQNKFFIFHEKSRFLFRNRPATTTTTEAPISRRRSGFRPSSQSTSSSLKQLTKPKSNEQQQPSPTASLPVPKVKLPRTQGRWSYKTTPKPRVIIRKQVDEEDLRATTEASTTESSFATILDEQGKTPVTAANAALISSGVVNAAQRKELFLAEDELDPSESEDVASISVQDQQQQAEEQILPVETLNVEISTAADLDSIYFEIATIKSPYSFQVNSFHLILIVVYLFVKYKNIEYQTLKN